MLVCWLLFYTSRTLLTIFYFYAHPCSTLSQRIAAYIGKLLPRQYSLIPFKNSRLKLSVFSSPHLPPLVLWSALSSKLRMPICPLGIHYKNSNRYACFKIYTSRRLQNLWIGLDVLLFNTLFRPFQLRQTPALPAPICRQQRISTSSTFSQKMTVQQNSVALDSRTCVVLWRWANHNCNMKTNKYCTVMQFIMCVVFDSIKTMNWKANVNSN